MNPRLHPATRDELRDTLDHALRYGRSGNPRRYTSDTIARIAADILVDHLELQNPEDGREIVADSTLEKVLGKKKVTMFEMNKLLSQHLT